MAIKLVSRSLFLIALLAGSGCSRPAPPPRADGIKPFQGVWNATTGADDKKLDVVAVFDKDILRLIESKGAGTDSLSTVAEKFAFRVDLTQTPAQIDLVCLDGENQSKTKLGIFAFENGKLKICVGDFDAGRPAEFAGDATATLLVFERES